MVMCPTAKCPTVGSRRDVAEAALLEALEAWLQNYRVSAKAQAAGQDLESTDTIKKALAQARKSLSGLEQQKSRLYDLVEQGVYTHEVFLERSRVLAGRISDTEKQVDALREHLAALKQAELARTSIVPRIQHVLDVYYTLETPEEKNRLLKTALDHVIYVKTVGGRYQDSDLQLYVFPKIPAQSDYL